MVGWGVVCIVRVGRVGLCWVGVGWGQVVGWGGMRWGRLGWGGMGWHRVGWAGLGSCGVVWFAAYGIGLGWVGRVGWNGVGSGGVGLRYCEVRVGWAGWGVYRRKEGVGAERAGTTRKNLHLCQFGKTTPLDSEPECTAHPPHSEPYGRSLTPTVHTLGRPSTPPDREFGAGPLAPALPDVPPSLFLLGHHLTHAQTTYIRH